MEMLNEEIHISLVETPLVITAAVKGATKDSDHVEKSTDATGHG